MKKIKMEHLSENLYWKIEHLNMRFDQYKDGILVGRDEFAVGELVRLILDHLGLEPRHVVSKDILQKKQR